MTSPGRTVSTTTSARPVHEPCPEGTLGRHHTYAGIDNRIVLEQRQDTDGQSLPRSDALHLYGVDLLATHDILTHFSAYNPTFVEWINDSSCNVCFPDEFAVKRIIIQMGEALTEQETTDSGGVLMLLRL